MADRRGFTLIEVLMAVTLTSVVGMAVYGSFSSGIQIMRRVADPVFEEDLTVFLEKVTRELENSFLYADTPFTGGKQEVTFMTIVRSNPALGGASAVGRVTYFYDPHEDSLSRRQEDVHQIYEEDEGKEEPLFRHVSSLSFQYFGYDASYSGYLWSEEWDPVLKKNTAPLAVKMQFEFDDGETEQSVTRTIWIPVGE